MCSSLLIAKGAIVQGKHVVCGVNSAPDKLEKGENENCRVFNVVDDKCVSILRADVSENVTEV
jgi:hypothetical protein